MIAFDGPSRSGKGTQIKFFSEFLKKKGIPFLVVRGDSSRTANGDIGNPRSKWWDEINKNIHKSLERERWHMAADRLVRELIYWRFRFLPKQMKLAESDIGYLLLDRSILSRAMVCIEKEKKNLSFQDLYPCSLNSFGKLKFDVAGICPDIIFLFSTTKDVLISRLNENDPKYEFRRLLIERKWDWYDRFLQYCPQNIVKNTLRIDASKDPNEIQKIIVDSLFLKRRIKKKQNRSK